MKSNLSIKVSLLLSAIFVGTALSGLAADVQTHTKSTVSKSDLKSKKKQLIQLSRQLHHDHRRGETGAEFEKRVGNHYTNRFNAILGPNNTPEELAELALWGYRQRDWWGDGVYDKLFFHNVALLGTLPGHRAQKALEEIKRTVKRDGRWDAHLSESVTEAEKQQAGLTVQKQQSKQDVQHKQPDLHEPRP